MKKSQLKKTRAIKYVFLFVGLVLSAWFLQLTYEKQKLNARAGIRKQLEQAASKINSELHVSTEVLYSISNLLNTFPTLTNKEFNEFTKNLSTRKDAILMIEWQPKVLEKDRESFIVEAKKKGVTNFEMLEPDPSGKMIRAKNRVEHYPVLFGISTRGHNLSIGLDLSWSPERMQSKYEARDIGKPMASNTFKVMHSNSSENTAPGFAITLPVYDRNETPETIEKRRLNLKGYLASVIYLDDFLDPMAQEFSNNNLEIRITDTSTKDIIRNELNRPILSLSETKEITIFGQEWLLEVYATDDFITNHTDRLQFIFPIVLFIFTIVLFVFLKYIEKKNDVLLKTRTHLQEALNTANVATHSKTIFLANMSHEIRTPMNAILGYANLIKSENDESTRLEFIKRMEKSGLHLLKILEDILQVSSHEISKIELRKDHFKLGELIQDVNNIMITRFKNSNVIFECKMQSEDVILYGDPVRLRQVLINLLNNSYKFTKEGFVSLYCHVENLEQHKLITIIVRDTGVGIDNKYLSNIYVPFSQENESFKRNQGGVGLGLSIVNNIIDLMGGKIMIDSTKGVGTKFTITIPFEHTQIKEQNLNNEAHLVSITDNILKDKRILAAEDDEDTMFLLKANLKGHELKVDYVENGVQLIEKFKENEYDLILTDIQMPELDGLSALKILRQQGVKIPVIIMSAHALPEEREKGLAVGASDYITKPLSKEDLINSIKKQFTS